MNDDFLPKDYQVPKSEGRYMRFDQGDNKFRILQKPVFGWEAWKDEDGKNVPVRFPMAKKPTDTSAFKEGKVSHFWAMPVWNYAQKAVQILQINQKTLQGAIEALARNEDWGSPLGYNITVKKEGEKLDTEYFVNPSPHTPLHDEVRSAWADVQSAGFDINELFYGGDPFAPVERVVEDDDAQDDPMKKVRDMQQLDPGDVPFQDQN